MQSALIAGVVIVGAIGLVNVLLLLAVLRRLREHEERLSRVRLRPSDDSEVTASTLAPGTKVGDFSATTVDGADVSASEFRDAPLLAAFFSATCASCREELPDFLDYAKAFPGEDRVLVVVSGSADDGADIITAARPHARVVVEEVQGPLVRAFGVQGAPAFLLLDRGASVRAVEINVNGLPTLVGRTAG